MNESAHGDVCASLNLFLWVRWSPLSIFNAQVIDTELTDGGYAEAMLMIQSHSGREVEEDDDGEDEVYYGSDEYEKSSQRGVFVLFLDVLDVPWGLPLKTDRKMDV